MLTIYMTVYNRVKYIRKAVESVLRQTYSDFDFIVLDNASTDGTSEILDSFCDERMQIIHRKENIGGIKNQNYALAHAESKYFMIVHDDDILEPCLVEKEIEYLEAHPKVAIVASSPIYIDGNDNKICSWKRNSPDCKKGFYYSGKEYFTNKFTSQNCGVICPSAMYRTEFINEHDLRFREEAGPACDFVMFSETNLLGGDIFVMDNTLINYRIHSDQDSYKLFQTFDLREVDCVFQIDRDLNQSIDPKVFSKALAQKMAFRAYKNAIHHGDRKQLRNEKTELESREYFIKYDIRSFVIILLAFYMPYLLRFIERIRKIHKKRIAK